MQYGGILKLWALNRRIKKSTDITVSIPSHVKVQLMFLLLCNSLWIPLYFHGWEAAKDIGVSSQTSFALLFTVPLGGTV